MTSINKLTKNSIVNPGDLLVIWDEENQRTRSISYDTLKAAVPYLESAEYISPNLILTQSDGETITVAIPSGGDVISGLLDGQVPVKDQATGQLVYSGATVNSETGQWVFDRTIEVPSSSLDVGDVVTISEGSTDLLISNNIDGIVSAVVSSQIDSTGAKPPSYFKFGPEKSFIPQPFDGQVITTNPLIASSTGRVVSPDVRQINQTIFRADQDMPNVVAEIKDKASGMVIKYIPSRAAWEAETEEDRARNPGLDFIAGDNVIDYVSREEDTPGVFNIGVSPFRLTEGQEFEIIIKADVMALKGISGVPYLAEMVQDGPEVFLVAEDDQYIDEIIAGNNVTVDSTDPKKPVISASGGSGGAGVTIDVDGVEITTGVNTLDFDSSTMTIVDENPADGTVKISAKIQEQTNFIGLFNTVSDLQTAYPTPKDGMYASVLDADGKPDDRYKSQSDSWVGIGAVSGDVFVNDNKSLGIITGDGLKYEDDSGNAKISLSGVTPVIEFDVTIDATRTVSPSMVGEVITIIQTPPVISIPMIISLEAHANFSIGDTVTISADRDGENPYTNYYFAVNYTDATGRNLVKYPANNITMIRTGGGWNVSMDGRFTNVSIRPKSQFGIPYAADEQYNTPVNAFVFAESDAVEFDVDEDTNTRIVKIDLDSVTPDLSNYVEKYSKADLSQMQLAYDGEYGDDRSFYPFTIKQDINGWTQEEFTGTKVIRHKDKDSGTLGDKVLQLSSTRIDINKQPYYGDYKLQTRTNNPIYRTYSQGDIIGSDNKSLTEWKAENPDYTPIEFVDRLFNSKVLDGTNWEASITLSGETFNSTLPLGYTQFRAFRTGGSSRCFMYLHNKESHTVMYAPYKSGVEPIFRKTAYADEIEEVVTDTLNDLISPKSPDELAAQYVFEDSKLEKGYLNGHTAINPFSYDDTYNRISYDYRNESSSNARSLFQVLTIKNKSIGYMMVKEDRLKNVLDAAGVYVPPTLKSEYGVRIQSETFIRLGGTGNPPVNPTSGGKYDYRGLAIPNTNPNNGALIDPNRQSNSFFLDDGANIVTDINQANSHFRTERQLGQSPLGNAGEDMNFSLKRGVIIFSKDGDKSDAFFVEDGNSPWYIMAVELNTTASVTEQYTTVIYKSGPDKAIASINLYPNSLAAALDGEALVLENKFKSKSGYNRLSSGGGSTHRIEFWENGSIFKLSNSKIEVRLLEGMHDEDGKRHGYVKYINSKGSDVNFEWYDRNGNQISNSSVPSVCPADTVVEIFANYSTDDYAINFSQSKVISSSISEAQTPSFAKFINKSTVTVDYPLDANGEQYRPVNAAVMILDTDNLISDLNITVTSSDSYDGHYNSIGVIAIDSNGEWTTQSRRNGYRLDDGTNTYCVYSDSLNSWVLVVASVDHNHIGSIVGGVPINLYNDGQLPESYGDYSIDNNLDSMILSISSVS